MGFPSRFSRADATRGEGIKETSNLGSLGAEKTSQLHLESGRSADGFHMTGEMEKRVVRKFDTRVLPLVMGLCMSVFRLGNTC